MLDANAPGCCLDSSDIVMIVATNRSQVPVYAGYADAQGGSIWPNRDFMQSERKPTSHARRLRSTLHEISPAFPRSPGPADRSMSRSSAPMEDEVSAERPYIDNARFYRFDWQHLLRFLR